MKYILILFFGFTAILSFAQTAPTNVATLRSKVSGSDTTAYIPFSGGYLGGLRFNQNIAKWQFTEDGGTTWKRLSSSVFPSQPGNSGKYLTTDGTNVSWATVTAGVSSVTGTTNRITVTGTSTPVVDISSSYIGQSSITTLGTIGAGIWQGTAVSDSYVSSSSTWNAKESALTFSAPLSRSTNTISIPVATNSIDGYLSAVDRTTFNNKQSPIAFGTGVQTAIGVNIGSVGAPILFNGDAGTPSSLIGTNITGIPNAGLTNSSITINGNSVSLGGSTTVSSTPSGTAGGDLAGTYPNPTLNTVSVAKGGTGQTSLTAYAPLFGGTTGTGNIQSGSVGTAGQILTSNGAGALPTFQTSTGNLPTYGTVFNETFSGTLGNYTQNLGAGITMSIVSGKLRIAAGTTNLLTNRMYYNVWGRTNTESFTMTSEITVGTIDATNYGVGFQQYSSAAGVQINNIMKISLETGNVGKITAYCVLGATPTLYTKTSDVGLSISTGDVLSFTWSFSNNRHFVTILNNTTGYSNSLEYVITLSIASAAGPSGAYNFAVNGFGGTNDVDNWKVVSNDAIGPDFLYVGDSRTRGNGSDHLIDRWANKIKDRYDVDVAVLAAAGALVEDANATDILRYAVLGQTKIVLDLGVNNLGGETPAATLTKMATLVSSLTSAGYVVGTDLFFHLSAPYAPSAANIVTYNAGLKSAYGAACIDVYTAMLSGTAYNTLYSTDGIHPNIQGQQFIANKHGEYFNLPLRTNRIANISQVLFNELNHYVNIGDFRNAIRTPSYILDVQQDGTDNAVATIHLNANTGTSIGSRDLGTYLGSTESSGTTTLSTDAAYISTSQYVAKASNIAAYRQFNGQHYWTAETGKTAGTTYTAGFVARLSASGFYIGGNAASNSTLQVAGSFAPAYIAKTANYTLTASDYGVDCTSNTFTITLPTSVSITGRKYAIKNSGSGTISIATTSSQTMDGNTSMVLYQNESVELQSDNANWKIISLKTNKEIRSTVSTYTNFTTTATYQNITSITLDPGDWDLSAFFTYSSNSATITAASNAVFTISTTTASASGSTEGLNISYVPQAALLGTSLFSDAISSYLVSPSSTTTYYLNGQATFTLGNPQYVGTLRARKIR